MAKSAWTTLTPDQKDNLVRRRYQEEIDLDELANELEMYPPTLDRRIREWRRMHKERLETYQFEKEIDGDERASFKKEVDGNTAELTGPAGRIVTLEQMLKYCEIDKEEWKVERYLVNKWEIARKQTEKDLVWEGGSLEGYSRDTGKFFTSPLFQVKVWLIRNKPIELFSTVQPVEISVTLPKDRIAFGPQDRPFGYTLIVPDIHVGFYRDFNTGKLDAYHDRGAVGLVLDVARDLEVDQIVFLGDNLDLPDWSEKFIRSPDFRNVTQPAIDELSWWLAQFRAACPDAKMVYEEGNHEHRMVKARQTNMIAAWDLRPASKVDFPPSLSIPSLLELDKLDIQWIDGYPDNEYWINDKLVTTHGARARAGAGATAKAMLALYDASVVFGHVHRLDAGIRTVKVEGGTGVIRAVCPGALCKMDGSVPGHTTAQDWSQGFALVYSDSKGDNIMPIEISDNRAMVAGKPFQKNESYLELLQQDLAHWRF